MSKRQATASQAASSSRILLQPRKRTAEVLGGVSIATVIRLERAGVLTPRRLGKSPTAQVFHSVAEVEAVAEEAGR